MAEVTKLGGWRYRIGLIVLVASFLSPLLIPLVAASGATTELKAMLSGLLALGIPELGILVAVAILGKPGYDEIKRRIIGFLGKYGPPDEVSPVRYRIGLVMFAGPLLIALLQPYAEHAFAEARIIELLTANKLIAAAMGDVVFVLSFVVLGGEFWDKIRALFVHGAKAVLPARAHQ